jgi:GTP-binding protein Era
MNRLVGTHVAIVSPVSQTTRHQIKGVMNGDGFQVVFVDTPGLHKPQDPLGDSLNRRVRSALSDVDVVVHVVDASVPIGTGDRYTARAIASGASGRPRLLVLSKVDLVKGGAKHALAAARDGGLGDYLRTLAVSSTEGYGLDALTKVLVGELPEGPMYFPDDMVTDQPLAQRIAEVIREAVLVRTREEVPHSVAVEVTDIEKRSKGGLTDVTATIVVDTESQKGIIIGKAGSMLKAVGSAARPLVEELVGGRVYLRLVVRCRRHWRDDPALLRRFGYSDG